MYIVIAYFCWNQNSCGFIAAIVLALSVVTMNVGFGGLVYLGDELLAIAQVLIVFFCARGYREIRAEQILQFTYLEVNDIGGFKDENQFDCSRDIADMIYTSNDIAERESILSLLQK